MAEIAKSDANAELFREPRQLDGSRPYVVRISGYDFVKFKQGLRQPYDAVFQYAMVLTMNDLVTCFQAITGYTHQFDIILVFDKNRSTVAQSPVRTLTAYTSYATVRFNHHMAEQIQSEFHVGSYLPSKYQQVMTKQTIFYATFFQAIDAGTTEASIFDEKLVLLKYLVDRCRHIALHRSLQQWTSTLLGPDSVNQYKSTEDMVHALASTRRIRWQLDVPL